MSTTEEASSSIQHPWDTRTEAMWEANKDINPFTKEAIRRKSEKKKLEESYENYQIYKRNQVLGIITIHRPTLRKVSLLTKEAYDFTKDKNLSELGKEERETNYFPLSFVRRLIEYLFEKEKNSFFSNVRQASLTDVQKGVVLLLREEIVYRLKLVRAKTRARGLQTALKTLPKGVTPKEETPESVLNKLDTWCNLYKEITVYQRVKESYKKKSIPAIEKELLQYIYHYYDITEGVARIYAYYILYYLQSLLSYFWNIEIYKQKEQHPGRTEYPIAFSEQMLSTYTEADTLFLPNKLRHVIPYHKLYEYLDPTFDVQKELAFFKKLIQNNPLHINYRLCDEQGNVKYFIEVLQDLESRNPKLAPLLVKLVSRSKGFLLPPPLEKRQSMTIRGGKRISIKKTT